MKLLLLLLTVFLSQEQVSCQFRTKPIFRKHPRRNETYVFFIEEKSKTDFFTAVNRCKSFGSVVHPRDQEDHDFLHDLADGHHTWLGSRLDHGFGFVRERGIKIVDQMAKNSDFENWDINEPTCYTYCCGIRMNPKGLWGTFLCAYDGHVLCRINPDLVDSIVEQNRVWIASEADILNTTEAVTLSSTTTSPTLTVSTHERITETKDNMNIVTRQLLEELTHRVVNLEKQNIELKEENNKIKILLEETSARIEGQVFNSTRDYVDRSLNSMSEEFGETIRSLVKLVENRG